MGMQFKPRPRGGFTLVELLVSIAIIGMLMALLVPAVQAAREAARRTQCRNHLKQLATAVHLHESAHQHIPGNGWGYLWVGEPDRGSGPEQPGGWIYQLLPYLEQVPLKQVGSGLTGAAKLSSLGDLTAKSLPILRCPSRPGSLLLPHNSALVWKNAEVRSSQSRTDYAINEGDYATDTDGGPETLLEGDAPTFVWKDMSKATGVSFLRSTLRIADIADGTSHTYLIGEKHVSSAHYTDAADPGYDQHPFGGVDLDLNRWTYFTPIHDDPRIDPRSFGSAHSGGCHMSFCDGSVKTISYGIDANVHRQLGNRCDGKPHGGTY